jgi:Rieske Fe-S protein
MKDDDTRKIAAAPLSRKTFFKWASLALIIPFYKLLESTANSKQANGIVKRELIVDAHFADGVHFYDKVILIKDKNEFRMLASKCSHLGCRINKVENGELVCPCHGSRYNLFGEPSKGPAIGSLAEIQFEKEQRQDKVILLFKI